LAWWNHLGPEAAYAHQRALARDFAERVRDCRGVTVLTPDPPPAGIVTVSVQGYGGAELTAALAERGVIGRAVQSGPLQGTRFSFAVFNNAADVARAADSVRAVATGAAV
jgi:selenocysteine lyase/cysteine desulfurase